MYIYIWLLAMKFVSYLQFDSAQQNSQISICWEQSKLSVQLTYYDYNCTRVWDQIFLVSQYGYIHIGVLSFLFL